MVSSQIPRFLGSTSGCGRNRRISVSSGVTRTCLFCEDLVVYSSHWQLIWAHRPVPFANPQGKQIEVSCDLQRAKTFLMGLATSWGLFYRNLCHIFSLVSWLSWAVLLCLQGTDTRFDRNINLRGSGFLRTQCTLVSAQDAVIGRKKQLHCDDRLQNINWRLCCQTLPSCLVFLLWQ